MVQNSMIVEETPKKSSHAKGWCGPRKVRSLCDFDGIDATGSQVHTLKSILQVISHCFLELAHIFFIFMVELNLWVV